MEFTEKELSLLMWSCNRALRSLPDHLHEKLADGINALVDKLGGEKSRRYPLPRLELTPFQIRYGD